MTRDYGAARALLAMVALVGWLLIAASAVFGYWTADSGGNLIGYAIAIGLLAAGVLNLALAQFLRALIDTASNTGAMLDLMRREFGNDGGTARPTESAPAGTFAAARREPTLGTSVPGNR